MSVEGVIKSIPGLTAGANMSVTGQYLFVKLAGNNSVVPCAATTDCPVGVLRNAPQLNAEADVAFSGVVKLTAGGAIAAGNRVGTNAAGQAVALVEGTNTTDYVAGQALVSAVAGDIFEVLLAGTPHRAA